MLYKSEAFNDSWKIEWNAEALFLSVCHQMEKNRWPSEEHMMAKLNGTQSDQEKLKLKF